MTKHRILLSFFLCTVFFLILGSCSTKTTNSRSQKFEESETNTELDQLAVIHTATSETPNKHNKFAFDCHIHVLQINHVPWSTYISFMEKNPLEQSIMVMSAEDYIFKDFFRTTKSSRNLLAVMERDAGDILLLYENDLRGKYEEKKPTVYDDSSASAIKELLQSTQENITGDTIIRPPQKTVLPFIHNDGITMLNNTYDYLVVSPLIMDFEIEKTGLNTYYKDDPVHDVEAQAWDVLNGIRDYKQKNPEGRLIIRPFMGINPINLDQEELEVFLEKYFGLWSGNEKDILQTWESISELDFQKGNPYGNAFAGIKFYPPLDFNPYPSNQKEREKMDYLYSFCEERGIPIITHCDDQGFRMINQTNSYEWTSPAQWEKVLQNYPNLYLDIAHFGHQYTVTALRQKQTIWRDKIVELMVKYPNVYSDLSFNGVDTSYWDEIQEFLNNMSPAVRAVVNQRLLFGTDWPLTLLKMDSVTAYYRGFENSSLGLSVKQKMISDNPGRFYFRD